MSHLDCKPGDRLGGKLSYVADGPRTASRKRQVEVQCDCGSRFICQLGNILCGNTTQCKTCSYASKATNQIRTWTHERQLFKRYARVARDRGLTFDLTQAEVAGLISQPCHYCGIESSANLNVNGRPYSYNGIDRKDNTVGYHILNCVPCCIWCNTSKGAKPLDEWLAWVARIHNRHNQEQPDVASVSARTIQCSAPWGKTRRLSGPP